MNVKIINGNLLLREGDKYKVTKETLFIKNNEILQVGGKVANENDFAVFDANDKLVMPGLINMHTHAYMTFLRNYADDVEFDECLLSSLRCLSEIHMHINKGCSSCHKHFHIS